MKIDSMAKANQQPVVLFVDDEQLCLDVGVKMLQKLGYNVLTARDEKEAVEIYKMNQEVVDLILLDLNMPYRGDFIFGKLKIINTNVTVLLTSGSYHEYRVKELLSRGCKGFIQKPFNLNMLSQNIEEVLNN